MNNETAEVDTQFNNQSVTTVNISYGTNYRFGAIQDGDAFAVYLNGSSAASSTYSDGLTLISNGNLVLGGRYNSSAFTAFWYGPVPEFDVMNADNTANISALDTYFTCAYGS